MKKLIMAAAVIASLTACKSGDKTEEKVNGLNLDGDWTVTASQMGDMVFPDIVLEDMSMNISGDRYKTVVMSTIETGALVIYEDTDPMRMDIIAEEGPNAGTTIKATFKFEGDELIVAYDLSGYEYPDTFTATAENQLIVSKYKR